MKLISPDSKKYWRKYTIGYLFLLPAFLTYSLFMIYPFVSSFVLSFFEWNGASLTRNFVGVGNYIALASDKLFWLSISNNLFWIFFGTVLPISVGMILALLLWSRPRGFLFFRTVFFLPQVLGEGIMAVIWKLIYQPRKGMLFEIGKLTGIEWMMLSPLAGMKTAQWAILVAAIWASSGFFFVIFLAGLQNVDKDLVDASKVDGANGWQRFINVVIPQLAPVITLVTVLAMIGGIKMFGLIHGMTGGGPGNATEVIATYAYRKFSTLSQVGYSAALTMVMAGIALLVTIVFIRLRERNEG